VVRDYHGYLGLAQAYLGQEAQATRSLDEYKKYYKRARNEYNLKTIRALLEKMDDEEMVARLVATLPRVAK
jgi:hypothetical protein